MTSSFCYEYKCWISVFVEQSTFPGFEIAVWELVLR